MPRQSGQHLQQRHYVYPGLWEGVATCRIHGSECALDRYRRSVPWILSRTHTTELIQEGLQLRTVKLYRRGERAEDIFRVIEYKHATAGNAVGGHREAQYAGCVKGKQLFEQLMARHGEEHLFEAVHQIWTKSAEGARAAVRKVPEGIDEAESFMDDDGSTLANLSLSKSRLSSRTANLQSIIPASLTR